MASGWIIECAGAEKYLQVTTRKVVVASGCTSEPTICEFKGRDDFGGPIVHTLDYGRAKIYDTKDIRSIAIISGGESATDMIYESLKASRQVK